MKVAVTSDCAGTGQCVAVAPDVFELDEDGRSVVHTDPDSSERREAALRAAALCPMAAITVEE